MQHRGWAAGTMVVVALGAPWAQANPCLDLTGPQRSSACAAAPVERNADRAEGLFWQERVESRAPESLPPPLPVMPPGAGRAFPAPISFAPGTKTGPLTLEDLRLVPDGRGGYRGRRPGYRFGIDRDGSVHFDDGPPVAITAFLLVGIAGIFDFTDLVMRLQGGDPYVYDKHRIMDLTRPMRDRMTDQDRGRRLEKALAALPRELAALWARTDLPVEERRALLFRLWDDLLDEADTPEAAAAARARGIIQDFITRTLPAGSREAFTPAELERWGRASRGGAPFAPYAPAETPPSEGD